MNYQELAVCLQTVGETLQEHFTKLSGAEPTKIAKALADNARKLDKLLQAAITQDSPDARRLREVFDQHGRSLAFETLQSLAKKSGFTLSKTKGITLEQARLKFIQLATANAVADRATQLLEAHARIHQAAPPKLDTAEKLREDLRRLGLQNVEIIEMELNARYSDGQILALATAAGLSIKKKAARSTVQKKLITQARIHAGNVG